MEKFKFISSEIFKYLATDFKYKVSNIKETSLSFDNSETEIFIYLEYSNVFLTIKQGDVSYDFGILYLLVFKQKIQTFNEILKTDSKIMLQLANYAVQLIKFLKHPLFQNSEWIILYEEFYTNMRHIQSKMGTKFSFSHPIYLKFISGDDSWKKDLTEFNNL